MNVSILNTNGMQLGLVTDPRHAARLAKLIVGDHVVLTIAEQAREYEVIATSYLRNMGAAFVTFNGERVHERVTNFERLTLTVAPARPKKRMRR